MSKVFSGAIVFGLFLGSLSLSACGQADPVADHAKAVQQADWDRIQSEIDKRGFAQVGTTPDGKPLYMKEIRPSEYSYSEVYFTADTITAQESCGKNCEKSVTTIIH